MNIGVIILLVLIFIYLVLWVGTGGIGRMRFKWLFAGSLLVIIAGLIFWNWNIVVFGLLGGGAGRCWRALVDLGAAVETVDEIRAAEIAGDAAVGVSRCLCSNRGEF